jgi:hypothetical protein
MTLPSDTPTSDDDIFTAPEPTAQEPKLVVLTTAKAVAPEAPVDIPAAVEPEPVAEAEPEVDPAETDLGRWLAAETEYKQWKRDQTVEPDWAHETIEYMGDTLGIRVPSQGALTAFTLGTGEFTPDLTRQSMTSMFVQNHLSPRSYGHVFRRMMTPGDSFDDNALGGLMRVMVEESSKAILAEQKAKEEAEASKKG